MKNNLNKNKNIFIWMAFIIIILGAIVGYFWGDVKINNPNFNNISMFNYILLFCVIFIICTLIFDIIITSYKRRKFGKFLFNINNPSKKQKKYLSIILCSITLFIIVLYFISSVALPET